MTTELRGYLLLAAISGGLCLACTWCVTGCAGSHDTRHGDRVDVSKYPREIQSAYRVFATRCSRCHTLARPLNARIEDPAHWVRYVERMRRNPSSGINRDNAKIILEFLLFYTRERVREKQEPTPTLTPPMTTTQGSTP
jgi:hypothetical protein